MTRIELLLAVGLISVLGFISLVVGSVGVKYGYERLRCSVIAEHYELATRVQLDVSPQCEAYAPFLGWMEV